MVIMSGAANSQSVSAPSSVDVVDATVYNLISASGTTISVAGFDPIKVVVSATSGTLKITNTAGLTAPTGYTTAEWTGSGEIGFSGSLSDVNNALATLQFLGNGTITVSPTSPSIFYSSVTGNFYEKSTTNKNFAAAKADAESRSLNGASGYLATVTSTAEFNYIKSKGGLSSGIWLGASDSAVEGEWRWIGGSESGQQFWQGGSGGSSVNGMWSDWGSGEPNNVGNEDYLQITTGGKLNDFNGTQLLTYVVEYTGSSIATSAAFPVTDRRPTMAIMAAEVGDGDTSGDASLSLTFTASEATADFAVGDISVTNGTISNFVAASSTVYTATFTPTAVGATTIDVAAGAFTDTSANNNIAATQFNWIYDGTGPTMAITAAEVGDGDTSGDASLSLTFTASEATADFAVGDISVTNGTISNFVAASSTVYTATFTPTAVGATTIDVAAGAFTDTSANNNIAATQFNWTYLSDPTLKVDVVAGLLSKELIAYQFYKSSIQSVNDRLAWLASKRGNPNKSKQGIKFNFGDPVLNQLLNSSPKRFRDYGESELATLASRLGSSPELYDGILKAQAISLGIAELKAKTGYTDLNPEFESTSKSWSVWTDGEVSVGKNSASTIASSREFNRTAITIGLDKDYEQDKLIGFALSAGREDADVGIAGSTIESDNLGAIIYTTYVSEHLPQIEASLGYGDLTFETKRIDRSETLTGERKGSVYYGSVGIRRSNTPQDKDISYSVHARLNLGQITLKSYSEAGGSTALTYFDQDIDYEELETGIEMSKTMKWHSLTIRPHTMVQYSHFLNKSSPATMRYVVSSQNYILTVPTEMQLGWSVSAGLDVWDDGNLSSNLALSRSQSNADNYINSVNFRLRYNF